MAVLLKPSGVISRTWPHASTTLSHNSLAAFTVDAGASCVHPVEHRRWANRTLASWSEVSILFLAWKGDYGVPVIAVAKFLDSRPLENGRGVLLEVKQICLGLISGAVVIEDRVVVNHSVVLLAVHCSLARKVVFVCVT